MWLGFIFGFFGFCGWNFVHLRVWLPLDPIFQESGKLTGTLVPMGSLFLGLREPNWHFGYHNLNNF
jgi:hypothetical protein